MFSGTATSGNITLTQHSVFYQFQVSAATAYGSGVNEGSPSTVTANTIVFIPEPSEILYTSIVNYVLLIQGYIASAMLLIYLVHTVAI